MTEDDARAWLAAHPVAGRCLAAFETFAAMLADENGRQNLISPATIDQIWARHIVDSAQLWDCADFANGRAVDIGSGGGLPGVVLAIMGATMTLCEPRRLRADFLQRCVTELRLSAASVVQRKGDGLGEGYDIVTARAVTNATDLISSVGIGPTYVLPRGRNAPRDYEDLSTAYHGVFHVKQSVTSPDSSIIIASRLKRRAR